MINKILSIAFIVLTFITINISCKNNQALRHKKAFALLAYGAIEIATKNETNTLNHIKFNPQTRTAKILEAKQDTYIEECIKQSKVVNIIQETDDDFSCFQYALEKIIGNIGFEEEISFPGRLFSIFIEDYFEQTKTPQPSDLVIYTYSKDEPQMTHFGIVINDEIIESKWGDAPEIRQHKLFNIPIHCGSAAFFYTLKKEYKGPRGKKRAAKEILDCLNLQKTILMQQFNK